MTIKIGRLEYLIIQKTAEKYWYPWVTRRKVTAPRKSFSLLISYLKKNKQSIESFIIGRTLKKWKKCYIEIYKNYISISRFSDSHVTFASFSYLLIIKNKIKKKIESKMLKVNSKYVLYNCEY